MLFNARSRGSLGPTRAPPPPVTREAPGKRSAATKLRVEWRRGGASAGSWNTRPLSTLLCADPQGGAAGRPPTESAQIYRLTTRRATFGSSVNPGSACTSQPRAPVVNRQSALAAVAVAHLENSFLFD